MAYTETATPVARETIISAVEMFERDIERLAKLQEVIERIGEHLEGALPQAASNTVAKLEQPAHSILDNLLKKHNSMSALLGRCEDAASRVTNAIGLTGR